MIPVGVKCFRYAHFSLQPSGMGMEVNRIHKTSFPRAFRHRHVQEIGERILGSRRFLFGDPVHLARKDS